MSSPAIRLLARALRRRRFSSILLVVVAMVAIAGAAVGPILLRSADNSTLSAALAAAPIGTNVVNVSNPNGAGPSAVQAAVAHPPGRWFGTPTVVTSAAVSVNAPNASFGATFLAATDICQHVRIVRGACPTETGDVAISQRSLVAAGWRFGETVTLEPPGGSGPGQSVRIVGLYDPPTQLDNTYWQGNDYFNLGGSPQQRRLDSVIASAATVENAPAGASPQASAEAPVDVTGVRATDVSTFERALAGWRASLSSAGFTTTAAFLLIFQNWTSDAGMMSTVVQAMALQVVLLSLLVFYALVSASGRDRRLEVDVARRRGYPRHLLIAVATGETMALLIVALPAGLLVAWLAAAVSAPSLFKVTTPVGLDGGGAVLAGLAGFAGAVLAAAAASRELWGGPRSGRRQVVALAVGDAMAVAVAAAGLVALHSQGSLGSGHPDPVALLAPGLLALGGGVLAVRATALLVRVVIRGTQYSRRVSTFLAVRTLARLRPAPLRQVLPLAAAVVLAVLAVESWAVAGHNRATLATFEVGAARVVSVDVASGVNLVQAVDRADPTGRQAMAVEVSTKFSDDLLAVQPSRFASVVAWPKGLASSATSVARYLAPSTPSPLEFAARNLRFQLTSGAPSPMTMSVEVTNLAGQNQDTFTIADVRPGTHTYVVSTQGFCVSTCRLIQLQPSTNGASGGASTVALSVDSLQTQTVSGGWAPLPGVAGSGWLAPDGGATATFSGGRLTFHINSQILGQGGPVLQAPGLPAVIPAVVTTQFTTYTNLSPPDDTAAVPGLDGNPINISARLVVPRLPALGQDAVMVSLPLAQLSQQSLSQATDQVWLSSSASPSILPRLRALGVDPTSSVSAAQSISSAAQGPLGRAYTIVLATAPLAVALAIGSAAFAIVVSGRRRRPEFAALAAAGVSRPVLGRGLAIENAVVLGTGLVTGAIIGVVATRLVLSSLPQFTNGTGGVPIDHTPLVGPLLLTLGVLFVLFTVTAVLPTLWAVPASSGDSSGGTTQ